MSPVNSEEVAIYLIDGQYGPHSNIYALGFPPSDEIVAFMTSGAVALCEMDKLDLALEQDPHATVYTKVQQSQLPALPGTIALVRGARYKAKVEDEGSGS